MIPLRLTLQGVYSYQDTPQTIEFGPLLDAGLFGIFGAVGSGKSSLLEAISMALYGEIERLNKRDDRNYNMMNLRSDRLYIVFEFRNYSGQKFRFECEGKRNSKQYKEVNTYRRMASEWIDDEWHPLDHYDGEKVTGLSYENFKRTVIIPQGKFQEFLELTPGGRSQMLQDLFSLDKYDLASATARLTSRNEEFIHRLEGRLTGYENVTREMIKEAREHLKVLTEQVEKSTQEYNRLKKQVADSTEFKQLHDQLTERQATFNKMKEKEPSIRSVEQQLKRYQEARQDFSGRISQVRLIEASLSTLQKSLDRLTKKKTELNTAKEKINRRHELLRQTVDGHDKELKYAGEASTAAKYRTVSDSLQHKEQRIKKGMKSVLNLQNLISDKEKTVEELEKKLSETQSSLPDRELLLELRNSYNRKAELSSQIEKLNGKIERSRLAFGEKKDSFFKEFDLTKYKEKEPMIDTVLEAKLDELAELKDSHRKKWHQLRVQSEMANYVEQLSPGESCPLCGSKEHPAPAHFKSTSQQIEQIENQISALETQQKNLQKAKLEWNNIRITKDDLDRNLVDEHNEINELKGSLRQTENKLNQHVVDYPKPDDVDKKLESSARMKEMILSIEGRIKKVKEEIQKDTLKLDKYRKKIDDFRSERDQLKGEASSLKSNLSERILGELEQHTPEEWRSLAERLINKVQQEKEEFQMITTERDQVVQEHIQMETSLKETTSYSDKERSQLLKVQEELESILSSSDFESLEDVREVLKNELDVEDVQKRIRDHDRTMHVIEEGIRDLENQIGEREFDGAVHEELLRKSEKWEKEVQEKREQRNYQSKKLEESEKLLKEKKELTDQLSKLRIRAENLKILEGLFRGKKFVDYVSTVYLREICEIANRRFRKLTNNHFSLVLGEDNQFLVRDYLHDGQIRSVKTLSGGQTFQVSLCLALALAESLQNQSRSHQNFFFLDEGFGTLDGDALRLVMESLKSLRQEGRVVGVISHVESLQDEMDMYLHIRNDEEKGSQIEKSWG